MTTTNRSQPQAEQQLVKVPQRFSWFAGGRLQWREYHVLVPAAQYLGAVIKRAQATAQRRSEEEYAERRRALARRALGYRR